MKLVTSPPESGFFSNEYESLQILTVMGYSIPAGCRVVVNAWAIGRDPRYWEDGESFRLERFDGSSIDFAVVASSIFTLVVGEGYAQD